MIIIVYSLSIISRLAFNPTADNRLEPPRLYLWLEVVVGVWFLIALLKIVVDERLSFERLHKGVVNLIDKGLHFFVQQLSIYVVFLEQFFDISKVIGKLRVD